ncbi:MAG: D-alanyl-D-alanine carboxypeptidase [Deltaproteobacteria bacterium]|nr:D-alanyl-D-alanine carboxypeptidase [Deltaproteobacteria bacterium]
MSRKSRQRPASILLIVSVTLLAVCFPRFSSGAEAPHPFNVAARSAVLLDATSGEILYAQEPEKRIKPASFVKLLTLFVIFDAVKSGQVNLQDKVLISKKAWRTGGSKMFVRVGDRIPLTDIIKGIAVVSGNDACVAAAEYLQGSVEAFVDRMNEKLQELGLHNSKVQTVNGLPAADQYTTAEDMALLARAYIQAHPEALEYHKLKQFTHEKIRQRNRNGLLWRDPSVDGLKTGHTEAAGYHLLATAKRGDQRFIAVVMCAKSVAVREREALRLLNYGFRNFATLRLFDQGQVLAEVVVRKGSEPRVGLVTREAGLVTVPATKKDKVSWKTEIPKYVMAPVQQDQQLGTVNILASGEVIKSLPLVASSAVPLGGIFKRTWDSLTLFAMNNQRTVLSTIVILCAIGVLFLVVRQRRASKARRKRKG